MRYTKASEFQTSDKIRNVKKLIDVVENHDLLKLSSTNENITKKYCYDRYDINHELIPSSCKQKIGRNMLLLIHTNKESIHIFPIDKHISVYICRLHCTRLSLHPRWRNQFLLMFLEQSFGPNNMNGIHHHNSNFLEIKKKLHYFSLLLF